LAVNLGGGFADFRVRDRQASLNPRIDAKAASTAGR